MSIFDLISTTDAQGDRRLSLTECSAFLLVTVPLGMGLHSYVTGHTWSVNLPEFCFYAWGCATGIKATKGSIGAVSNYYGSKGQGGKMY